jgi:hypothetical protein
MILFIKLFYHPLKGSFLVIKGEKAIILKFKNWKMRIGLIRREYITHLDGVNRFIALCMKPLKSSDRNA